MKRKLKQGWSTIPPISIKHTLKIITTYDFGNACPGLGTDTGCGKVRAINGIPTLAS
jgi:hypothetical protein